MQTLLAGRAHDDLQLLDVSADRIDGVVLGGEPGDEVVVELQVDVGKVELLAFGFAVFVELHDKSLVVLDGRGAISEFVDVQPGALLHFAREAGDVVAERFTGADAAACGEAARVVEAVDDLLQPRLRHCVFGILGNLSENVATQFGEVLVSSRPCCSVKSSVKVKRLLTVCFYRPRRRRAPDTGYRHRTRCADRR